MNQIPAAGKDRHLLQSLLLGIPAVDEPNHCTWSAKVKLILPCCATKAELSISEAWVNYDKDKTTYITATHYRYSNKLVQHLHNMLNTGQH